MVSPLSNRLVIFTLLNLVKIENNATYLMSKTLKFFQGHSNQWALLALSQ